MPSDSDHNKLIKQAANGVLKPNGLFQKGTSRMWIDDNGWYLTIVEFQPSNWSRGSYLNVAVCFLWDEKDYLSFDYSAGPVHRVGKFVAFDRDEDKFLSEIHALAEAGLDKVKEYRRLRDLEHAKACVSQHKAFHIIRTLYSQMMICGLCRDPKARDYCDQLFMELPCYADTPWTRTYCTELAEKIAPIVGDPDLFYAYICEKVSRQRAFWRAKSSMKKLREDFKFDL